MSKRMRQALKARQNRGSAKRTIESGEAKPAQKDHKPHSIDCIALSALGPLFATHTSTSQTQPGLNSSQRFAPESPFRRFAIRPHAHTSLLDSPAPLATVASGGKNDVGP